METNEVKWQFFNVHLAWPDQHFEKLCVSALSKRDALLDPKIRDTINAGAYPVKVIGPLGQKESTHKQKLAHHYRWILGNITSASATLSRTKFLDDKMAVKDALKIPNAVALAQSQFAKLQRDVRDLFKLAGLKIK